MADLSAASRPTRATATPTPNQCPDHHIRLKPRTDGARACGFCRRGVPPFEPRLATVIPLSTREVS